jgi:Arylsulfotransferase (ASST)
MSQDGKRVSPAVVVPVAGGVFLAFALGLALGVTGKPPSALLRKAISGASEIWSYSRDGWTATPSQHLRARPHKGDGVTVSLPVEMQPGVTLLSGLFGQTLGFRLYATDGTLLKEWPIDFFKIAPEEMKHRYHALIHGEHLYPNGDIVANLDGRGLVRFDACGKVLWRNHDQSHHAIFVDEKGDIWTPVGTEKQTDRSIAPEPFRFDHVARFNPETGEKIEEIDLLKSLQEGPGTGLVQVNLQRLDDVLHVNDVEVLSAAMAPAFPMFRAGDILVSSRNLQQLWVLDREDHRVKWWFAGPNLSQHDPDFQPDGTISMFDNRPGGEPTAANGYKGALGGSRILSVDPATGGSRVLYQSDDRNIFYSTYRGKHEILPNGNILIAETDGGRAFEVTAAGKVVWEFVNGWNATHVGWVLGAERYPPDYAAIPGISCN